MSEFRDLVKEVVRSACRTALLEAGFTPDDYFMDMDSPMGMYAGMLIIHKFQNNCLPSQTLTSLQQAMCTLNIVMYSYQFLLVFSHLGQLEFTVATARSL